MSRGEWTRHGFAAAGSALPSAESVEDTLPRVDGRGLTPAQFAEQWEAPGRPCIITHLTDDWPAAREWTPERLAEKYGSHRFKVRKLLVMNHGSLCFSVRKTLWVGFLEEGERQAAAMD